MAATASPRYGFALAVALCLLGVAVAQFQNNNQFNGFDPSLSLCSPFDGSPRAIVECLNAVRANPQLFQRQAQCQVQLRPFQPVPPLEINEDLTGSAEAHAIDQADRLQLLPFGFDQRIRGAGFEGRIVGSIVDFTGGNSAFNTVVNRWLCNPQDAQTLMTCGFQFVGVGVECPRFQGTVASPSGGCVHTVDFGGDGSCLPPAFGQGGPFGPFGQNPFPQPPAGDD